VHLSTIAVHDPKLTGWIDESTPIRPAPGDYGPTKVAAERAVLRAAAAGLPAAVIRPGCVYGPFSRTFTFRPVEALAAGRFGWVGSPDAPANTVYVDNLVELIVRTLVAPEGVVRGEVFAVTDGDGLSWRDFVGYFATALGLELPPPDVTAPPRRAGGGAFRWATRWLTASRDLVTSPEARGLARRFVLDHPFGAPLRWALRFPRLERAARRLAGADGVSSYRRAVTPRVPDTFLGSSPFQVRVDKARQVLGYGPLVPPGRALELTLGWVRHARLVG
jgi:hypothetical protein